MAEKFPGGNIERYGEKVKKDCPNCKGKGRVIDENTKKEKTCTRCSGSGKIEVK